MYLQFVLLFFQQQSVYFEYKHEYIISITVIYDDIKVVTGVTYMCLRLCCVNVPHKPERPREQR